MPYEVNSKQCSTCIFGNRSPISQARFNDLKAEWESKGIVQECHASTIQHEHIGCRGYHEASRRGEIDNNPVMTIAASMGLSALRPEQAFGFLEAMGAIVFVDVKDAK